MEAELQQKLKTWVCKALQNQNFENLKIDFPSYDCRGGYAAEVLCVDVTGEKNGSAKTLNLLIKKNRYSGSVQDTLNLEVAYSNEVNIYSKLIPVLQKFTEDKNAIPFENIPLCYGTIIEENQYIIILENLKPKGFKVHDIKEPMDLNHIKLLLDPYAKWHGMCFALKDQYPKIIEEIGKLNKGMQETKLYDTFLKTVSSEIDAVVDMYKEKDSKNLIEKLKALKSEYGTLLTDSLNNKDEDYLVIKHGDCWNNNFLFHYNEGDPNPDKAVIIDWQLGTLGSPMLDLTNVLFYCCSRRELEHLEDLLTLYYETLSKKIKELGSNPEKCFPWDALQKSFKRYAPLSIALVALTAKMAGKIDTGETIGLDQLDLDGTFSALFNGELRDPEECFQRYNGIFDLCIERGYL